MSKNYFKDKEILITGGTGFIGSNLAIALANLGAQVTLLARTKKSMDDFPQTPSKINLITGDIRDAKAVEDAVSKKNIIFNLAAQVSHMDKGIASYEDLDINCRGQLTVLEACRTHNPTAKILFSSTRMVYSSHLNKHIKESDPTEPATLYGIHKLTAERYHLLYYNRYGLKTTIVRIGNPYGDRQNQSKGLYSLPGWFMNKAINKEAIAIWGDGTQVRDYIYIGDLISAFIAICKSKKTNGQIYNCGSGVGSQFKEMVEHIATITGSDKVIHTKWPDHYPKNTDDSYSLDISKLKKDTNWTPTTSLKKGIQKMYNYHKKYYDY